jgi:hypothetical protein
VADVTGLRVGGAVEESLIGAFVDGSVLSCMLKVFAETDFVSKKPRGLAQTSDQVTRELQLMRAGGWPGDIESACLVENNEKHRRAILGWVWQVIAKDQLSRYGGKATDEVNEIYRWVDRYLADHYDDVDRGDALKGLPAFQDGKLLSYLVHRTNPNAIDLSEMYEAPVEEVTDRAIKSASDKLGVPPLVDSEDIIGAPNDKSLVTYLNAFRETVENADREIYDWVDKYLENKYPDVPPGYPQRGIESFKDGRLLDYLVHKGHPDAVNLDAHRNLSPRNRVDKAVEAARQALHFNPRLTGDDLAKNNEDKLKRYLNDLRHALEQEDADRNGKEAERRAAEEAEERRRREAARLAAEEDERRRLEAERRWAEEEERKRRETARRAAEEEEERKRREAARRAAEEEDERRLREAARRAAEEEEERRRRADDANRIRGIRSIWPQQILIAELKEVSELVEFDGEADARQTRMFGPGLERAQVGATATFVVETRNAKGQPVRTGGAPFKLHVDGPSSGQAPEIQSIVDNGDGTYTAKYVPQVAGNHEVRVTLRGQNVAQSPVRVYADAAPDQAPRAVAAVDDELDDLRRILEAIAREIARDQRNVGKLPKIVRKLEQVGLTNEQAKDLAYEVGQEDDPRLNDFLRQIAAAKDKALDMLDNPRMSKSEIRKALTPMIKNIVGNMDDWADDYANVMDKIKNLRPSGKGGQRQRVHLWIHRKGVPVPQHILVTTNKPSAMNYRRHIRVDASKGFYDTHTDPAGYLDGLLGLTGELKLQKIDSRDRYLTGGKDKEESELELDSAADVEANIVNERGQRVRVSEEPLLLEGGLQNEKGQAVYGFLYADVLAVTQVVNNGERYVLRSLIKFDKDSSVTPSYKGNMRSFLVRGKRGKERGFTAKSKDIAAAWVSNLNVVSKTKKGAF